MSDGVTRTVAGWLAGLGHEDIPEPVRRAVRLFVLDTLGVGLVGMDQPWTGIVADWVSRWAPGRGPLARRWGSGRADLRPSDAALVNGVAAHAFELDDFHNAKLHPGAVVVPAALATAEAYGGAGERLETAIVAGYEVMIRTALALEPSHARLRGWHLTGVCGTFGAAAATAVLLGFDAERTAWALGLAGTQSAGLFAFNADGSMSKRFHPGRSAQSGVLAAELAAMGFTGPTSVYEAADGGLLKAFSDHSDPGPLVGGLGATWHAAETTFKPYSCCGSVHPHIDAALALRASYRPGARVRAGVARVVDVQCGYPYRPGTALNAQMSLRYCVAVALTDGAVLPRQFAADRIADRTVTALAESIEVVHDPALDAIYPGRFAGWVEVEEAPGRFRRVDVLDPSGSPANPGRDAALRAKFRALAAPILGEAGAERVEAAVGDLDRWSAGDLLGFLERPAA